MITCVVAMDEQGNIGYKNHMPWHIKEELHLFRCLTRHHTILLGHKTWMSIGRPLPQRKLLVASRTIHAYPKDVCGILDVETVLKQYHYAKEELMVCGGEEIYRLALPYTTRIYLSKIKGEYQADTRFPIKELSSFICVDHIAYASFTWYYYQRKKDVPCAL